MIDALLVYPRLGSMDTMIVELPLSILYAAAASVQRGYDVRLLDMRCVRGDWREALRSLLDEGVRLLGVSVMTGMPLKHAREIALFVREHYPAVRIVWGGPHVTVLPETLGEPFLDYLVRGYGSEPLAELIRCLREGQAPSNVAGISYKDEAGTPVHVPREREFERLDFRHIPYHLLDPVSPCYQRAYKETMLFPIFTAVGCPYQCTFCVSPAVYREIQGKKWLADPVEEVVAHIEMLKARYGVTRFSVIDDTSFVQLPRMRQLFTLLKERNLGIRLEFRGARVNEIDKMDDAFLELMADVGGEVLMVGVESASDRLLKQMSKAIDREQIFRVNRKLARHPRIHPHYNFIYGVPGETYEDLKETKDGVLTLLKDNPQAYFGFGGDWKPIPGTVMLEEAEQNYGYRGPRTLDDWIQMDSSDARHKIVHPWYTRRHDNLIRLMQMASFVIDDKIVKETRGVNRPLFVLLRLLARLYKPVALLRLRFNLHHLMVEYALWQGMIRLLGGRKGG